MKKVAFVTGASRGIGKGIAIALARAGVDVAIGYRKNKELAEKIAWKNGGVAIAVDIASRDSICTAMTECENHFGASIDILVNNAALAQEKPFHAITDDDWDRMLAVNLRSAFAFSQEVLPAMIAKRWGRIINITSIGGQWGGFNQVHYAAAKAGLISLTRSLARIYSGSGVTTNAVAPGLVATNMSSRELDTDAGKDKVKNIPVGRIARVDEVAEVVVFLASDAASYVTGQTINVNGGMYFG
ncbi:MAG: 3-oxoacyl-ACP reductase family protein [bacterium]